MYKIISLSIGSILRNEINKWIYPSEKFDKITKIGNTISIGIPIELLEVLNSVCENNKRSEVIREFIRNLLTSLNNTFKHSFPLFTSTARFIIESLLSNILDKVESKICKIEQKNIYWIKLNGKDMLKNDFTILVLKDIIKEYEVK